VTDPTQFAAEQKVACGVLLQSAAIATPLLSKFSAWLMAGLGAAFTLFVTNIASVATYVSTSSLRWALFLFAASLLLGLFARYLSVMIAAGVASNEVLGKQIAQSIGSSEHFVFPAFFKFYFSGLLLPYRCIASRTLDAVKRGDLMVSARFTAKTSQTQALMVLGQIFCATASVIVLACGIKV